MAAIPDGIYGSLTGDNGFSCVTLERTWDGVPKIPKGTYTCEIGMFTLEGADHEDEYFQVLNVPHHTHILIHPANRTYQLNGCIAVGDETGNDMICNSDDAFKKFMASVSNVDSFTLEIK